MATQWDSELEESEPEESDTDSDSSEDDIFDETITAESVSKAGPVTKKGMTRPKNAAGDVSSGDEMNCSDHPKDEPKRRPKDKGLKDGAKSTNRSQSNNKDVRHTLLVCSLCGNSCLLTGLLSFFAVQFESGDSSADDSEEMPLHKVKPAPKKTSKKTIEHNDTLCDITSDNDSNMCVSSSKKHTQSWTKSKVLCTKKASQKRKEQQEDVSVPHVGLNHMICVWLTHTPVFNGVSLLVS